MFLGGHEGKQSDILSDDCRAMLARCLSVLPSTWNELQSGEISLFMLEIVHKQCTQFIELMSMCDSIRNISPEYVKNVVQTRMNELKAFGDVKRDVCVLLTYCSLLECGKI